MTEYRSRRPASLSATRARHSRALSDTQRQAVVKVLSHEQFVDCAPSKVCHQLLDQGNYLCSTRTIYRILHQHKAARERWNQRRLPSYSAPQLVAARPNEVWSWDITKLQGPGKFELFYVYTVIDIYSRKVVGWLVAERESGALAQALIVTRHRFWIQS